jgi:hypothetical protein
VKVRKARRAPSAAVVAIQLLGQWNRISGAHVALGGGCSCGVASSGLRVQDFEEQILDYLHARHGGRFASVSELLTGIAKNPQHGSAQVLQDLQRTLDSFEQQHGGR